MAKSKLRQAINQLDEQIAFNKGEKIGRQNAIDEILKEYKKKFYYIGKDIHPPYNKYSVPFVNVEMIEEFKQKLEDMKQ